MNFQAISKGIRRYSIELKFNINFIVIDIQFHNKWTVKSFQKQQDAIQFDLITDYIKLQSSSWNFFPKYLSQY